MLAGVFVRQILGYHLALFDELAQRTGSTPALGVLCRYLYSLSFDRFLAHVRGSGAIGTYKNPSFVNSPAVKYAFCKPLALCFRFC